MEERLSISFVLPMFNERDNIGATIFAVKSLAGEIAWDYEIIVVDDASTDGCGDIVEGMARDDDTIKLFRLTSNSKFGGAFARGFKNSGKDTIIYMDSDMPVKVEDIKASLPLIRAADIVTGYSRVKKGDTVKRKVMSGLYNLTVQALFGLNIKDINSGYKIVRKKVIDDIEFVSRSPFVDVELFLHARKKGFKVHQYPLVFYPRTEGRSYISSIPIMWATFADMLKVKFLSFRRSA
ncbi:MAG: glycosyltransferase [Candidatus Omnitrophota bacterium]|nr:glycosyltransferase [Candidatus Omnitrophota bacterium]